LTGSGTSNNLVEGDYLGTNASGTAAMPNGTGVLIQSGATNNTVGGITATAGQGAGNVISGNTSDGVALLVGLNTVQGNLIGTDKTGTTALGNGNMGIDLNFANSDTIGGTTAGAGNIIADNKYGIWGQTSSNNLIAGNYIGTDITGTLDRRNHNI